MGVFVDSEQKLIFESFWLRFGSICLHFSSRVPLLHATPPTFCLSDFTTPTFLFVSFYNSNLFLCRLIWHFFIVNIALPDASVLCNFWFYIVASSMNQNLGREQKGFIKGTFISFQSGFVAAEARVINSGSFPLFPLSFLFCAAGSQDDVLFQCSRFYILLLY